jgi:hypothetical protein
MMFIELIARFLRAIRNFATLTLEALLTGRVAFGFYEAPTAGRAAATGAVGTVLAALVLVAFIHIWPLAVDASGLRGEFKRRLVESDRYHLAPEILDAEGRFLLALPYYNPRMPEVASYFGNKDTGREGHWNSVFVERPNPHFLDCVTFLEDRYHDNYWLNPHGIDLTFFPRAPFQVIRKGRLGAIGGGSTLTAQFQQQLGVLKGSERGLPRKIREMSFRTADMADVVGQDTRRYGQLAARALPHVANVSGHGDTVHGIALASRLLFGKPQEAMSEAEAYLLASAVRLQVMFRYRFDTDKASNVIAMNDQGSDKVLKRWKRKILYRAGTCATDGPLKDNPERRKAVLGQIARWREKLPHPRADPVVNAYGRSFHARTRGNPDFWYDPARDPLDHGGALMEQSLNGLRTELRHAFGYDWGAIVNSVRLTMDIRDERRFVPAFQNRVRSWLRSLDAEERLNGCYRDWAHWDAARRFVPAPKTCQDTPEIIVAAADADGRIVRYYSSRDVQSYFGSGRRGADDFEYDETRESRQLASIAKIGAVLAFVRAGETGPDVRSAIARSATPEITELLSSRIRNLGVIAEELTRLLKWSKSSNKRLAFNTPDLPSIALSKGTYAASPRTIHHDVSALLNAFMNRDGPVYAPTLVSRVAYLDYPAGRVSGGYARLPDYHALRGKPISPWEEGRIPQAGEILPRIEGSLASPASPINPLTLVPRRQRNAALDLLSAPVCMKGGTLSTLIGWCSPQRTRLIFGKSGTHDISTDFAARNHRYRDISGIVQALWLAGGVQFRDGRAYSIVFLVAGTADVPLTLPRKRGDDGVEASAAAPLLGFVLDDLERHPPAAARLEEGRNED